MYLLGVGIRDLLNTRAGRGQTFSNSPGSSRARRVQEKRGGAGSGEERAPAKSFVAEDVEVGQVMEEAEVAGVSTDDGDIVVLGHVAHIAEV